MNDRYTCPVCGYPDLYEAPRDADGDGTYEICPSCGFEFGVTDDDEGFSDEQWRNEWIKNGMQWWSASLGSPAGWNPREQLERVLGTGGSPN